MAIGSVNGGGNSYVLTNPVKSKAAETIQQFLDFVKKSPMERMQDAWLASHKLTKADLAAMDPKQRQAILDQMAADIKRQIEADAKKKSGVDMLV